MPLAIPASLRDHLLSKTPIGLAVATWLKPKLLSTLSTHGFKKVENLSHEAVRTMDFFRSGHPPGILVISSNFIGDNLGGFSTPDDNKTIRFPHKTIHRIVNINWPEIPPSVLIISESKSFPLCTNDGRDIETLTIAHIDLRYITHVIEMWSLKQAEITSLYDKLSRSHDELLLTQKEMVERLARAIEARDHTTGGHVRRMQDYAMVLAKKCNDVSPADYDILAHATALHDIGKIAIKDSILTKPGGLTSEEFATMQTHSEEGAKILSLRTGEPELQEGRMPLLEKSCAVACSHHEKWDGTGYPNRLKGEEIPLWGRIVAIVDVFDALVSDRPYKKGWSFDKAMQEIKEGADKGQFDPRLASLFLESTEEIRAIHAKLSQPENPPDSTAEAPHTCEKKPTVKPPVTQP